MCAIQPVLCWPACLPELLQRSQGAGSLYRTTDDASTGRRTACLSAYASRCCGRFSTGQSCSTDSAGGCWPTSIVAVKCQPVGTSRVQYIGYMKPWSSFDCICHFVKILKGHLGGTARVARAYPVVAPLRPWAPGGPGGRPDSPGPTAAPACGPRARSFDKIDCLCQPPPSYSC